MRRTCIVLTLLLLAAAAAAEGDVARIFATWDADKNGVLTPDELTDEGTFRRVDANGDGKLTIEEVTRFLEGAKPKPPADEPAPAPPKDAPKKEAPKSEAAPTEPRTIPERVEEFFRRFDANKDRKIQKDEFRAGDEVFAKYDRNRDAALSVREVTRYITELIREAKRRPTRDNFFDLFDLDRDKRVTRREYDGPPDFFRDLDHDNDRVVTEAELNAGPEGTMVRKGDEDFMADGPTKLPVQGLLERYDEDGDGKITLEELNNAENVLRRLDKNGDGVLSGSEVR
jgi:Ca2+-binding EF-hand superfamily protein